MKPRPTVESRLPNSNFIDLPKNQPITYIKPKRGRPTEIKRDITKTSQSGLREGLTRATFIIREDTLDKLKERAYTDRKKLKDLVSEALDYYLDNYKETNQAYMPFRYPKWMFWKKNKVYLAVACKNRLYLVDPETPSVTEAEQSIK